MIEVNLLPLKNVLSQQEKQIRQNLTFFATVIGILVLICAVISFSTNTFLEFQNSQQQKSRDNLLTELKNNDYEAAFALRTIENKISGIKEIKKMQTDFGKMTGDILNMILPNAQVTSFSLDTTGAVELTAVSSSLQNFGKFMDKVTSPTNAPLPFKEISISGIRQNGNSINFALGMKYEKIKSL